MTELESQVRKTLWEYLSRRTSLDEFRASFVPISLDIEKSGDAQAMQLAHHIDGLLAEASSASWTEEELCEELAGSFAASGKALDRR